MSSEKRRNYNLLTDTLQMYSNSTTNMKMNQKQSLPAVKIPIQLTNGELNLVDTYYKQNVRIIQLIIKRQLKQKINIWAEDIYKKNLGCHLSKDKQRQAPPQEGQFRRLESTRRDVTWKRKVNAILENLPGKAQVETIQREYSKEFRIIG
ncbi:unnamed protein product [Paramecium octaurelia]|uniref:Uncharacterized protein n=1 Tax=Paramecium octaurelia TaxID=43137 RepID=A0A8S1SY06_PAROT|nr:unnamed protein product [Paramecium octaurelia]